MRAVLSAFVFLAVTVVAPAGDSGITVAAYYFGNYHPGDARNDRIKGPGWTEWDLVKVARPRFPGHHEPNVPLWGYTDESDPKVMARKIAAAADHGIDVFIFDWYYYNDGPFLEATIDRGFLGAPNNGRIKFAVMWANHDWQDIQPYRKGTPRKVLFPGQVTPATFDRMVRHLIDDYFDRSNYWRIDGRPYFSVYNLGKLLEDFGGIEGARAALDEFRAKAKAAGFPGLYLNAVITGGAIPVPGGAPVAPERLVAQLGFDSVTDYVWIHHVALDSEPTPYARVRDAYLKYWTAAERRFPVPYFPNVTMGWDPSPRADQRDKLDNSGYPFTYVIAGNTPARFKAALREVRARLLASGCHPRIVTLNAWNEWTEGSYLEPDTRNGFGYLQAIRDVFGGPGTMLRVARRRFSANLAP